MDHVGYILYIFIYLLVMYVCRYVYYLYIFIYNYIIYTIDN